MSVVVPSASRIARAVVSGPATRIFRVIEQRKLAPGIFHFTAEPFSAIVVICDQAVTLPARVTAAAQAAGLTHTAEFVSTTRRGRPSLRAARTWSNVTAPVIVCEAQENMDLVLSQCAQSWHAYAQLMVDPGRWMEQWPMHVLEARLLSCAYTGAQMRACLYP